MLKYNLKIVFILQATTRKLTSPITTSTASTSTTSATSTTTTSRTTSATISCTTYTCIANNMPTCVPLEELCDGKILCDDSSDEIPELHIYAPNCTGK